MRVFVNISFIRLCVWGMGYKIYSINLGFGRVIVLVKSRIRIKDGNDKEIIVLILDLGEGLESLNGIWGYIFNFCNFDLV